MKKLNKYVIKYNYYRALGLPVLLVLLGIISISQTAKSQIPGNIDYSFNSQGYVSDDQGIIDTYHKVLVQPDQKIVTVGMSWNSEYIAKVVVVRYLPDGSKDLSFGISGSFEYNLDAEALAYDAVLSPEGKIIIAGSTTDYSKYRILLIQLNPDGSMDPAFGNDGVVTSVVGLVEANGEDMAYGVDLDANGNILVCGSSFDEEYFRRPVVLRYSPEGVLDTSFGDNGVATIPVTNAENIFDCIAVQPDGKIVAAGHYAQELLYFVLLVTRFNEDGSLDTSFGDGGVVKYSYSNVDDQAYSMSLRPDGKILLAGFSGSQDYNYNSLLMQFTEAGQPDSSFGENGVVGLDNGNFDVIEDVKILSNGDIVAVGTSGEGPPNPYHLAVWKYNADGSLDNEFGTNGLVQHEVDAFYIMLHSMAFQEDGKLVIAGQARLQADNDFFVSRLVMESPTSILDVSANLFEIYPNPSKGASQIQIGNTSSQNWESVSIFSMTGQLLQSSPLNLINGSFQITSNLAPGVYLIRLENKALQSGSQKLIITAK